MGISIRHIVLVGILLAAGCTENGNGVIIPLPMPEALKTGTIASPEQWAATDSLYHITADLSVESDVTFKKGITVTVDAAAVIRISNGGRLTIEDGCILSFGNGASIAVGEFSAGTFIASGTAAAPVSFKSDVPSSVWGSSLALHNAGIRLGDSATGCSLTYCAITGALSGIYCAAPSAIITNCMISSCQGDGIYFDTASGPADPVSFSNNILSGCSGYPLTLPARMLGNLTGSNTFSGTAEGKNAIRILGSKVEDSTAVWQKLSLPYFFTGTTLISSFERICRITVMPGTICSFDTGACFVIGSPCYGSGILTAIGTPTDSIYFINGSAGSIWGDSLGGIQVGMESPTETVFEYCSFKNATNGLYVNPGVRVTVLHCSITGSVNDGIWFDGGSPYDSLSFAYNICSRNGGYGISITEDKLIPFFESNILVDNGKGALNIVPVSEE